MSEREFVVINEEAARTAQNMMSFNEYQLDPEPKNTRRTSTKYMIWQKK